MRSRQSGTNDRFDASLPEMSHDRGGLTEDIGKLAATACADGA
jgi:hypothetical protein